MAAKAHPNFFGQVNELVDEHVVPAMRDIITDPDAPPFAKIAAAKFMTEQGKGTPQPATPPVDERKAIARAMRGLKTADIAALLAQLAPDIETLDAEYEEIHAPALAAPTPEDDPLLQ